MANPELTQGIESYPEESDQQFWTISDRRVKIELYLIFGSKVKTIFWAKNLLNIFQKN